MYSINICFNIFICNKFSNFLWNIFKVLEPEKKEKKSLSPPSPPQKKKYLYFRKWNFFAFILTKILYFLKGKLFLCLLWRSLFLYLQERKPALPSPSPKNPKKFPLSQEMELSSSNIKKFLYLWKWNPASTLKIFL